MEINKSSEHDRKWKRYDGCCLFEENRWKSVGACCRVSFQLADYLKYNVCIDMYVV